MDKSDDTALLIDRWVELKFVLRVLNPRPNFSCVSLQMGQDQVKGP